MYGLQGELIHPRWVMGYEACYRAGDREVISRAIIMQM